jgi:hypothetical protein
MKEKEQLKPNYAPVYAAALYPGLARIAHQHGYALAAHGSCANDFDLIFVPWTEQCSSMDTVVKEITTEFAITECGSPSVRPHGRISRFFSVGFGRCALDISFFPQV